GDLGAECGGDAGCHLCVVGAVREEQADRAESQRQAHLEPHARRNDAFLLQLAEHEMRADRVFRVAEPPTRIAEPNLRDAGPDAESQWLLDPGNFYQATSARFSDPAPQRSLAPRAQ